MAPLEVYRTVQTGRGPRPYPGMEYKVASLGSEWSALMEMPTLGVKVKVAMLCVVAELLRSFLREGFVEWGDPSKAGGGI